MHREFSRHPQLAEVKRVDDKFNPLVRMDTSGQNQLASSLEARLKMYANVLVPDIGVKIDLMPERITPLYTSAYRHLEAMKLDVSGNAQGQKIHEGVVMARNMFNNDGKYVDDKGQQSTFDSIVATMESRKHAACTLPPNGGAISNFEETASKGLGMAEELFRRGQIVQAAKVLDAVGVFDVPPPPGSMFTGSRGELAQEYTQRFQERIMFAWRKGANLQEKMQAWVVLRHLKKEFGSTFIGGVGHAYHGWSKLGNLLINGWDDNTGNHIKGINEEGLEALNRINDTKASNKRDSCKGMESLFVQIGGVPNLTPYRWKLSDMYPTETNLKKKADEEVKSMLEQFSHTIVFDPAEDWDPSVDQFHEIDSQSKVARVPQDAVIVEKISAPYGRQKEYLWKVSYMGEGDRSGTRRKVEAYFVGSDTNKADIEGLLISFPSGIITSINNQALNASGENFLVPQGAKSYLVERKELDMIEHEKKTAKKRNDENSFRVRVLNNVKQALHTIFKHGFGLHNL